MWFERILTSLEFDPRLAKDTPQPRPPPKKIADMIRMADCFVAVVTRRTKVEGEDNWLGPEWIQNEIGMAFEVEKPMAIFVEEGIDAGGLGPWTTDYVTFERDELGSSAPNVVRYLVNLKRILTQSPLTRAEDIPTARALMTELWRFVSLVKSVDKPTTLPWQMSYITSIHTGRFWMLPKSVQKEVQSAYAAIDDFSELVKPSFSWPKKEETAFASEDLDQIESARKRVMESGAAATFALMQLGYPEEWKDLVERIKKGELSLDYSE